MSRKEEEGEESQEVSVPEQKSLYRQCADVLDKYIFTEEDVKSTAERPMFSKSERWNIFIYILGIMAYKFGLESYNGSVRALAIDRFTTMGMSTFTYSGILDGFNAAAQCLGSILVGPLLSMFRVGNVMTISMIGFALLSMIIMCLEKNSGGTMPTNCVQTGLTPPKCTGAIAGTWDILQIIPIFVFGGIPFGIIEMIRRVIPQQIVGSDEHKLKKMDSLVHMYLEISGTAGAFFSAYVSLICGKAYGTIITPPLYAIAAVLWFFLRLQAPPITPEIAEEEAKLAESVTIFQKLSLFCVYTKNAFYGFFESVYDGALIVIFDPRFQWLFFGYTIPLVMHRYIESGVASFFAKLELNESAYASFIVSGSNAGELTGAFFVFWNLNRFYTPLPFVRWDALVLNFTWLYYNTVGMAALQNIDPSNVAGIMAAIMFFISAGWAAGDVSMAAYIQSNIPRISITTKNTNPLGAVMSFLYSSSIIIFAIISPMIGWWMDDFTYRSKQPQNKKFKTFILKDQKDQYFYWIAGVFFSLISILIFANTFVPKGSWAWNPKCIGEDSDINELSTEDDVEGSDYTDPEIQMQVIDNEE